MLLHKFLQFVTNRDVMAFATAKLAASTFRRLRVKTILLRRFIRGGVVNAAMGGCGEGVANT